jgi:hypothetical protein
MIGPYRPEIGYPKKNILHSLLWLSGIAFPCGSLAIAFGGPLGWIPFVVGCLPVIASLFYYRHWSNREPDRLQSEDYRLEREALAKFGSRGMEISVGHDRQAMTSNPQALLGQGKSDDLP